MNGPYTDERNAQIVISLLKAHKIKRIIVSPGTTNACLVGSLQNDDFFELYSAPDERSAGYMACGLAAETNEPVVLSCTGATASRNYYPSLTEAFYRKLPILVITSSRRNAYIGHYIEQVTDRTEIPNDIVQVSVQMPLVFDSISEWNCIISANKAMLELFRKDRGPAHINIETCYSTGTVKTYEPVRAIYRIFDKDVYPELSGKIAIIVGSHVVFSEELTKAIEEFCRKYNAIVLCDHTSNYSGNYKVFGCLAAFQDGWKTKFNKVDVVIHIGYVTAAVYKVDMKEVWRVDPDGELHDTFQKLKYVFETSEIDFFNKYNNMRSDTIESSFYNECISEDINLRSNIPDLPFSNAWIAQRTSYCLPQKSILHLGINNSLRVWNFFDHKVFIPGYANVGGYGIDGVLSSAIGAALATDRIVYCVIGDLAFFYDMNSFGNRHVPSNVRVLIINNGIGMEMNFNHALAHKITDSLGVNNEAYVSAKGHYGNKSSTLLMNYVTNLGFEYYPVSSKQEYEDILPIFLDEKKRTKSMVIEAFVDSTDETSANAMLSGILQNHAAMLKHTIKNVLGEKAVDSIKKLSKDSIFNG